LIYMSQRFDRQWMLHADNVYFSES